MTLSSSAAIHSTMANIHNSISVTSNAIYFTLKPSDPACFKPQTSTIMECKRRLSHIFTLLWKKWWAAGISEGLGSYEWQLVPGGQWNMAGHLLGQYWCDVFLHYSEVAVWECKRGGGEVENGNVLAQRSGMQQVWRKWSSYTFKSTGIRESVCLCVCFGFFFFF